MNYKKKTSFLKKAWDWIRSMQNLIMREIRSSIRLNIFLKFHMWYHGFLSESYHIYSLKNNNIKNYLSDYQRFVKTKQINGIYSIILDNKLIFYNMLHLYASNVSSVYGIINNGEFNDLYFDKNHNNVSSIQKLVRNRENFVLKPATGGGGKDIFIIKNKNGKLFINDLSSLFP